MKFAKTFCRPSATVSVAPAGLPVKLQYNQYGMLQKVSIGFSLDLDPQYEDSDAGDYDHDALLHQIQKVVPNVISAKGGTSWVYGVMYTDRIPCEEGVIPQALYKSYIKDILGGGTYTFYAGYIHSLAASFAGPVVVRNFLTTSRFNVLPQVMVPLTMTDDTLQMLMQPSSYPFKDEFIAGFFIFEDLNCRYSASSLFQMKVKNEPKPIVEADGFIKGEVKTASGRTYMFNYSAIIHHGVSKGCTLLVEHNSVENDAVLNILATRAGVGVDKIVDNLGQEIKCPVCGKLLRTGSDDLPVQCDDPHCLSSSYNDAIKMLHTLGLPEMSFKSYKALVDSKRIICLTDLLELPPCEDQEIKTTMANAMYSVIPTYVVPHADILERFANKCNHNVETATYYLHNPRRIETDFDITDPAVRRLAKWLDDPYNVTTVETIFSRATLLTTVKKYEGDPIFRGVKIAVTGKFKRGDYEEIKSILSSYDATVIPSIELGEDLPDVLLIGSLNDGISGQMVQKANAHKIAINYEDDFFEKYEIDKDLQENLL